jgi:hypothetical protein
MAKPRIILWDIETTHNLAAVFQLKHNDYINAENIVQERVIVCAAWKELGKQKVHAVSTLENSGSKAGKLLDDEQVCRKLQEVLSSADVIIAHNGDQYDLPFTKGRMLVHKLPPLPPILSIDTLKVARKQFLLNANNLNYLGSLLKVGNKKPTKQGLWLKVLQGDQSAIRQMVTYNKEDVRLLERVFMKLQPHIADHTNRQLFGTSGHGRLECPRCGSADVQSRGIHRAMTQTYQRYQCKACAGWFRERRATPGTSTRTRTL